LGGCAEDEVMRDLLFTLAMLDCWKASFLICGRDYGLAARHLALAVGYLESRSRARDPREPWQPVLGADREGRRAAA
jgi:hypothetical protein